MSDKVVFDSRQQEVIGIKEGFHLVLAPPGCGKTDILARRMERALAEGVRPDEMLCLTFTNRAARSMSQRVDSALQNRGDVAEKPFVGSIHRFCSRFLYSNDYISGQAAMMDENDQNDIIESIVPQQNLMKPFVKEQRPGSGFYKIDEPLMHLCFMNHDVRADKLVKERRLKSIFSGCQHVIVRLAHLVTQLQMGFPTDVLQHSELLKSPLLDIIRKQNNLLNNRDALLHAYENSDKIDHGNDLAMRIYLRLLANARDYNRYKAEFRLLDFDDLLSQTLFWLKAESMGKHTDLTDSADSFESSNEENKNLLNPLNLREPENSKLKTQNSKLKYRWIQVDEVQDLNPMQLAIVYELASETAVFFGDEQQAIFSFMGAKLSTLQQLKERCGQNVWRLERNYRSPKYLLDVYNAFATDLLNVDSALLPQPKDDDCGSPFDLIIKAYDNDEAEIDGITGPALDYYMRQGGRTAIIVPFNTMADEVSRRLEQRGIGHFKVSGADVFSSKEVKCLLAHLTVFSSQFNTMAWARLLWNACSAMTYRDHQFAYSDARRLVKDMTAKGLSPLDALNPMPGDTILSRFVRDYAGKDIVIFDTETTGLDVANDDIVQIAAIKLRNGSVVEGSALNIFLHTDRPIPPMLGDIENPLIAEYAANKQWGRAEGLLHFLDYAKGCVLLGHNVNYDCRILHFNLCRDCGVSDFWERHPVVYDTLQLAHLIRPQLHVFKLKSLLETLNLEGQNSHLANDDILATKSLADFCCAEGQRLVEEQPDFMSLYEEIFDEFSHKYHAVYQRTARLLLSSGVSLADHLRDIHDDMVARGMILPVGKIGHLCRFVANNVVDCDAERTLLAQIEAHAIDLNTYREADLCDDETISERVFVSTVHKAKGLEFDNVMVASVEDGIYPYVGCKDADERMEDARKLYVALSRAKRRLCLSYHLLQMGYQRHPSPFLNAIKQFFRR